MLNPEFVEYFYDLKASTLEKYESYYKHEYFDPIMTKLLMDAEEYFSKASTGKDEILWSTSHSKYVWLNYYLDQWALKFLQKSGE